jgi:hypothetical protein
MYKLKIRQIQDEWLEDESNVNLWLGTSQEGTLTASARRILITQWAGEAHRRLQDEKYKHMFWRAFERTGT